MQVESGALIPAIGLRNDANRYHDLTAVRDDIAAWLVGAQMSGAFPG